MAKIFFSYSIQDKELAHKIAKSLSEAGHDINLGGEYSPGVQLDEILVKNIKAADAVIFVITERSLLDKRFSGKEIPFLMGGADFSSKFVIPVIFGEIDPPSYLSSLRSIHTDNASNFEEVAKSINQTLNHYIAVQKVKREENEASREKLESSAADYVGDAIEELKDREEQNSKLGVRWYVAGYSSLVIAAIIALGLLVYGLIKGEALTDWGILVFLSFKAIILIVLLIALSKYSFNLGKSYMHESLKNGDRIHAISFGKFYLQAFGKGASPEDVKEVFQHWNIDSKTIFSEVSSESFDPKLAESIAAILNAIGKKDK